MSERRLIRLLIYLIVSIAVVILLYNIPKGNTENKSTKKLPDKTNDSIDNTHLLIGDYLFVRKSPGKNIQLPSNDSIAEELVNYEIRIDSSGKYIVDEQTISKNELEKAIRVQIENDVKLIFEITVHPKSKSEVLLDLIELAKQNGIKVKLIQKNL